MGPQTPSWRLRALTVSLISVAAILALGAEGSAAQPGREQASAEACNKSGRQGAWLVDGGAVLCLYGPIDAKLAETVSRMDLREGQIVVVDSPGGAVGAALTSSVTASGGRA
jgi:hypothetical protein